MLVAGLSAALVLLVLAVITGLALWLLVAGDREQDIVDEPPTLDTRNHLDD